MKFDLKRYAKFNIVGFIGIIPNYIIYYILRNFIPIDYAWLVGIFAGALSNYLINENWTFENASNN